MYKSLLRAVVCSLLVSPLLASDTSTEDGRKQRAIPSRTETYEEYSARMLAYINTPEYAEASAREHRIRMMRDPEYRKQQEEEERIRRGLQPRMILH